MRHVEWQHEDADQQLRSGNQVVHRNVLEDQLCLALVFNHEKGLHKKPQKTQKAQERFKKGESYSSRCCNAFFVLCLLCLCAFLWLSFQRWLTMPAKNHNHSSSSKCRIASLRAKAVHIETNLLRHVRYRYRGTPATCGTVEKSSAVLSGDSMSRRLFW